MVAWFEHLRVMLEFSDYLGLVKREYRGVVVGYNVPDFLWTCRIMVIICLSEGSWIRTNIWRAVVINSIRILCRVMNKLHSSVGIVCVW